MMSVANVKCDNNPRAIRLISNLENDLRFRLLLLRGAALLLALLAGRLFLFLAFGLGLVDRLAAAGRQLGFVLLGCSGRSGEGK